MQNRSRQRCAACGAEAPASSRFCGQCGKPLGPAEEEQAPPAGQPAPGDTPIFLHTSTRSYQVVGDPLTPPQPSKTRPLPWSWLDETLQAEPPRTTSRPRPFPFPAEEEGSDEGTPAGASAEPAAPVMPPQSQTPLPPPLPRTPPTPVGGQAGKVPEWLSSVVADLEEQPSPREEQRSWKKRTLLIVLASVGLVAVMVLAFFLLRSHGFF